MRSGAREAFADFAVEECRKIQFGLLAASREFTESNIEIFNGAFSEFVNEAGGKPGKWFNLGWSFPDDGAMKPFLDELAKLRRSVRIVSDEGNEPSRRCIATGEPAKASILVAKAY